VKNEIVQVQSSELILAKTKKLMGFTQKILSKQSSLAVKKEDKALAHALIAGRYRDEGNGTVTDITTNLQWQRFHVGQRWGNEGVIGKVDKLRFDQAAEAAQQSNYLGYTDWRVPTIEELQSLVYSSSGLPKTWNDTGTACEGDYQKPTICLEAFPWPDFEDDYWASVVWSSSPYASYSYGAWGIYFYDGYANSVNRGFDRRVRLVRSGQ
jgi:hypothetical protein